MAYKVSLLSTDYDLGDVRRELTQYLNGLGFSVLAFEEADFGLHPGLHSHDVCIRNVESCDIAVLVIDSRFGGKYRDSEEKSITQVEWERARELRKPIIPCIKQEAFTRAHELEGMAKRTGVEDPGDYFESYEVIQFLRLVRTTGPDNFCLFFSDLPDLKVKLRQKLASLSRYFLLEVAKAQFEQHGRLRTAAPTDLSLREFFDEGLFFDPPFHRRGRARDDNKLLELLENSDGLPALILGGPGMGKSTVLYWAHKNALGHVASGGPIPIFLNLPHLSDPTSSKQNLMLEVMQQSPKGEYPLVTEVEVDYAFLIDGLDEFVSGSPDQATKLSVSDAIGGAFLVCCRTQEFDTLMQTPSITKQFATIGELLPWCPDLIDRYITSATEHHPKTKRLLKQALTKNQMQTLVSSPLMLRMLVFIALESTTVSGFTRASLYRTFFRLWITRERARPGPSQLLEKDVMEYWHSIAVEAYSQNGLNPFPYPVLRIAANDSDDRDLKSDERALVLFDQNERGVRFIHPSYQEFLIADSVLNSLLGNDISVLNQHITREIRGFIVDISETQGSSHLLIDKLGSLLQSDPKSGNLTAQNQAIYLLGHLTCDKSLALLRDLRALPLQQFVLGSLFWSLTRRGDENAKSKYLTLLKASEDILDGADALNRGYHLFYYGEWQGQPEPPYLDIEPTPWPRSRVALIQQLKSKSESDKHSLILSLYTLLRFLETRGDHLSSPETKVINRVCQHLSNEGDYEGSFAEEVFSRFSLIGKR